MKSFNDLLFDVAWKNLENHNARYKDLDTKAVGIISIIGILITFIVKPVDNIHISTTLFMLTSFSFLITILLCIGTIMTRKVKVISTDNLIEYLSEESEERQIKGIIGTIAAAEKEMCEVSNAKATVLKYTIFALGFSIILLIFYSISGFI